GRLGGLELLLQGPGHSARR
ncbi:hypothetical protein BN1723_019501, partial [Verticillium longisporum]